MALKKVKRPILQGEDKSLEGKGWENIVDNKNELKETTNDLSQKHSSSVLSDYSSDCDANLEVNADSIHEDKAEYESRSMAGKSALNRIISFTEDSVKFLRSAKIEQGKYYFRIDDIASEENVVGKFGKYDQFLITFSLYKIAMDAPVQITIPYTISKKPESPLMLFLAKFKSIFEGQSIIIKQLIGLKGNCEINHYKTDAGDVYEKLLVKSVEYPN